MFKKKFKCPLCGRKPGKEENIAELRLETSEGIHTMDVCNVCAEFLDKTSQLLLQKHDEEFGVEEVD